MRLSFAPLAAAALAVALPTFAAAHEGHDAAPAAAVKKAPAREAPAAPPTDAEIAAIVVSANQVDVDAGQFAKEKTKSADVKQFAQMMITDHSSVNAQAAALVKKLGVTPAPNATSRSLEEGGTANLAALKKLEGAAFDRAYVDHEVAYHVAVLQTIDDTLIPNAKNAELKALIVAVRPAIAAHLEHAKMLQTQLAGTK